MSKKIFKVNEKELNKALDNAKVNYLKRVTKQFESPATALTQVHFLGVRDLVKAAIEYSENGYRIVLDQLHSRHGFYLLVEKPKSVIDSELKTVLDRVRQQFEDNLLVEKKAYVEQLISNEEQKLAAKVEAIKTKEEAKAAKDMEDRKAKLLEELG